MSADRKYHDIVLHEVRKPAGYGTLIAVLPIGSRKRELWFQNHDDAAIVRSVVVDLKGGSADKAITIKSRGERDRG